MPVEESKEGIRVVVPAEESKEEIGITVPDRRPYPRKKEVWKLLRWRILPAPTPQRRAHRTCKIYYTYSEDTYKIRMFEYILTERAYVGRS